MLAYVGNCRYIYMCVSVLTASLPSYVYYKNSFLDNIRVTCVCVCVCVQFDVAYMEMECLGLEDTLATRQIQHLHQSQTCAH